ncbi:hypothetical protein POM88_044476 [Heracleum sosnowskyi]|uniref:Uncharacterized protein n=1 Tax=Heracleum sosnowskyi TaxID=360622 RepID=A0AAD8M5C0_9APIA|nr:hypothetical protein POM88_044476 [Heracleum sosnowskyi]
MVRTRSGIEARLTQKDNDEDEFVNEDVVEEEQMETTGEDDNTGEEEEMGTDGEQMETQYVRNDIDFENISMDELKLCFGVAIGEFDSLYFRTPELKIYLLNAESKPKLIELKIRKASREEKKKMDEFEKESNLAEMYETEFEDSDSDKGFYPNSEESDEEFCYANPYCK